MFAKCVRPPLRASDQVPHSSSKFSIFVVLQENFKALRHTGAGQSRFDCSTGAWLFNTEIDLASICNYASM